MTQLIINGTAYPETSNGKYKCYPYNSGKDLVMASGRTVTEIGYTKMRIEYSYDYFPETLKNQCLSDLRSNTELTVTYLKDDGSGTETGTFKCLIGSRPMPSFAFSRGGVAYWSGISFVLEGVEAID